MGEEDCVELFQTSDERNEIEAESARWHVRVMRNREVKEGDVGILYSREVLPERRRVGRHGS